MIIFAIISDFFAVDSDRNAAYKTEIVFCNIILQSLFVNFSLTCLKNISIAHFGLFTLTD